MMAATRRSILASWRPGADTLALLGALLASAVILPLAGARPQFAWAGWVVLVPLFVVIRTCGPWAAAGYGALWGLCAATVATQLSPAAETLISSLLGGVIAVVVPAIYAGLGAWLTRRIAFSPFTLGTMWIGVELVFAAAVPELSLFRAIGDHGQWSHWVVTVLGYSFIAFIAAYVNSLIVETITRVPRLGVSALRVFRSVADSARILASQISDFVITHSVGPHPARGPPVSS